MPTPTPPGTVRPTTPVDLPDLARLWNDAAVMRHVGFPDGLGITADDLGRWWDALDGDPRRRHLTIEAPDLGYCGEAHDRADPAGETATVDIKLRPAAQGRGLGALGLSAALDELFGRDLARRATVDPHRDNAPALRLYERLGFRPDPEGSTAEGHVVLAVTAAAWAARSARPG